MSVTKYEKDGKTFWRVYLDLRSRKNPTARVQKRVNGFNSEREALTEEKHLLRELTEQLTQLEAKGLRWREVVDRWEDQQRTYPSKSYSPTTIIDHASLMRNWTQPWLNRIASELNRGDGREIDRKAQEAGKTGTFRKRLKNTINVIYKWGIEEKLIQGVHESPVFGLEVRLDRDERRPEVLTSEEIRTLLRKAKEQKHPWYPVWVAAVLTGCRSGELHQIRKNDIEIIPKDQGIKEDQKSFQHRRYGFLRVRRSWNTRFRHTGPTKAGYWRNVPISSEFYWFLMNELQFEKMKPDDYLFQRSWEWDKGEQARVIRTFCLGNQLRSIKFHTLRACFATQLIATGIPATVVMKICGWKDMKTMQRYIRLAGIEEAGATEALRFIPTEEAVMEKVVKLFDYQG